MLIEVIKYTDYNEVEKELECRFNLTQAEFARMDAKYGGFSETLQKYINEKDSAKMLSFYEDLILSSYGVKGPDGEFYKLDENGNKLSNKFSQTIAYDTLLTKLLYEEGASVKFIKGVLPKKLAEKIDDKEVEKKAAELLNKSNK